MKEDLSALKLRLSCLKDEIISSLKRKEFLEKQILSYAKYKIKQTVYIYTDPYNCNNPTWYDCIVKKVYIDKNTFKYLVQIPSVATQYCSLYPLEESLKDSKPARRL